MAQARTAREAGPSKDKRRGPRPAKAARPPGAGPPPGGIGPEERGGGVKRGPPLSRVTSSIKTETGASLAIQSNTDLRAPVRARALAAAEARESLRSLVTKCRSHTSAAVDVLVDVMQNSTHGPSRVAAARAVIEFGNGKAPETVRLEKLYSPEEVKLLAEAVALRRQREGVIDGGSLGGVPSAEKR